MSKVPVLVTGGAGYIGSHAVLALRDRGWDVAVIDDLSTGNRALVPDDVPFTLGSVADRPVVDALLRERGIGAIMHFAGSIVVPESVERPLDYYANNVIASHALIGAAVAAKVPHFLFSSTAAVYGEPMEMPVDEQAPTNPINPYGASKLMVERMLADCAAAYGFNYGALRYFNVAGADPQGRSGQAGKGSTHLIKVAVEAASGKRERITVFGGDYPTADGTCVRDYIHVSDLADAHVAAIEWLIARPRDNLLMNCGYGRGYSVLDVLDCVDRANGARIERIMAERRAGDPPELVAATAQIRSTLGWTPNHDDLDEIVRDALAWERRL